MKFAIVIITFLLVVAASPVPPPTSSPLPPKIITASSYPPAPVPPMAIGPIKPTPIDFEDKSLHSLLKTQEEFARLLVSPDFDKEIPPLSFHEQQLKEAIMAKDNILIEELLSCPICLDTLGAESLAILSCQHVLHKNCWEQIPDRSAVRSLDRGENVVRSLYGAITGDEHKPCPLCRTPAKVVNENGEELLDEEEADEEVLVIPAVSSSSSRPIACRRKLSISSTASDQQRSFARQVLTLFEEKGWITVDPIHNKVKSSFRSIDTPSSSFTNWLLNWLGETLCLTVGYAEDDDRAYGGRVGRLSGPRSDQSPPPSATSVNEEDESMSMALAMSDVY